MPLKCHLFLKAIDRNYASAPGLSVCIAKEDVSSPVDVANGYTDPLEDVYRNWDAPIRPQKAALDMDSCILHMTVDHSCPTVYQKAQQLAYNMAIRTRR